MRFLLTLILVLSALSTETVMAVSAHFFGTPTGEAARIELQLIFFNVIVGVAMLVFFMDIGKHGWRGRP